MADGTWSVAQAKAKLSEVVESARTKGPQHLTKNGKEAAVVLSASEYRRLIATPSANPLVDSSVRLLTRKEVETLFARDRDPGRVVGF